MRSSVIVALLAGTAISAPAYAQESGTGNAPPPEATPVAATAATPGKQVYTPADFARYAPKNAWDMIQRVPGFSVRDNENLRGLGQATGNVLFNGRRPSTKSDDMYTLLSRIPAANVERIEIVDGASLDIPGLSGQVANVVYEAGGLKGQFSLAGEVRAHYADPLFTQGAISVSGRTGEVEYEVGLDNSNANRSAAGGPTLIHDGTGALIETRHDVWHENYDAPKLSAKLTWDRPGGDVGHLNGAYQRVYDHYDEIGDRYSPGIADRVRTVTQLNDTWNYELGGDYEFALGPGRLKAIGLRRFSHEPFSQEIVTDFADATPTQGDLYRQTGDLGETIARAEYTWKMLGGEWQLSGEGAFNTLDNVAGLFTLDPASGNYVELPFPGGTGGVSEDRYEGLLSFGHKLTNRLSFQLVAGAEHSTIAQTGPNGLTRSFFRPKGSLSLSWKPTDTLDMALKIRRRVLQLSFYDFLARAFLDDGNANSGNNELRPQQDWSFEGEINKNLGPWGSQQFRFVYRAVEDYVDVVPIPGGGESVGNVPKSWAGAIVSTSTIKFDPAGLKGLRLDATFVIQTSHLKDPFTGEVRQWSGFVDRQANVSLRYDVPDSNWALGGGANYNRVQPRYRSDSVDRTWEGPVFANLFVENKDVAGLTVRAQVNNLLNARSRRERTVWTGLRDATPIAFIESRDRLIGPTFSLSVKGNF